MGKDEQLWKIVDIHPFDGFYSDIDEVIGMKGTMTDVIVHLEGWRGGTFTVRKRRIKEDRYFDLGESVPFYKIKVRPTTWRGIKKL